MTGVLEHDSETHLLPCASHNPTVYAGDGGNVWTALAHIITAVIGSGVLSLSWSVAQLGWIAGPLSLLLFALVTLLNASLLVNFHHYPDPHNNVTVTNHSYLQAVQNILGNPSGRICAMLVYFNLFKVGVVYTITSASSIRAIEQSNCFHEQGHEAACEYRVEFYMLLFGIIHIVASQIPNIHSAKWLSVMAAAMSFAYSLIGSGLGLAQTIGNGKIKGSVGGVPTDEPIQKVWLVAQAIGDIAFAYPFHLIFLDVQSTLKSPPSKEVTMKKASRIAILITTVFYLCCGGFGYAAFGNSTPGNMLSGFGFYEPYWLIDFANVCVFLHLIGGYQIQSQVLYAIFERWYAEKYPESEFTSDFHILEIRLNPLRLCFRTSYVILTTAIGMLFPYFNEAVAFAGSVTFWPLVIYFPVEMYLVLKKIAPWTETKPLNHVVEIAIDGEHQKQIVSAMKAIAAIQDHPLMEISESPGHLLLLKLLQREEDLSARRISRLQTRLDTLKRQVFQLCLFFFTFHGLFFTILFTSYNNNNYNDDSTNDNSTNNDNGCSKWWIPMMTCLTFCLVMVVLVQMKLFGYWKVYRQIQREKNDSRGLTRCIQELRMKGVSFDLSKGPGNGNRMKSSSVEIKWKPVTWCSQYFVTISLVMFSGLVLPFCKFMICA